MSGCHCFDAMGGFYMILVDGLFLSALTLVTGGYHSFLYCFLGLDRAEARERARATSQIC